MPAAAFTHRIQNAAGELIQDGKMYVFGARRHHHGRHLLRRGARRQRRTAAHEQKLAAFIEECKKGGTTEAELAVRKRGHAHGAASRTR